MWPFRYFGSLQAAMVALINKDYADFVSLSSNLVGLDPVIDSLVSPLQELQANVSGARRVIQPAASAPPNRAHAAVPPKAS